MKCPHCHQNGSRVVDSRPSEDGSFIRRRRECVHCGFRFTTFERYEETPLLVVKKDGTRQEFSRQKILNGIVRSAEKRPVSMERLTKLKDVDEVAYIRFASVYRQFKDVDAFMSELETMVKTEHKSND